MSYTVGEVARLTGVTVRALHHYDEIGLLPPGDRSPAGYRRYTEPDLERLPQILTYRELGFPLEEISTILADPAVTWPEGLRDLYQWVDIRWRASGRLPLMSVILRTVAVSDRGKARENNEDAVHAGSRLVAVADGVGGGPSGEVASAIVIKALAALDTEPEPPAPADALREAVDAANRGIRDAIEADPSLDGMGTTLTAILTDGDQLDLVHVGDSRAYAWRDGELTQLTRDDTYVQGLVDKGVISPAEARSHPQRALVTQAVHGAGISPTFATVTPREGDRYLLCSDGLSDYVADEAIAQTLREQPELADCARQLVQLALAAGAPDNVSVILADVQRS
jgi:protein phosphatase